MLLEFPRITVIASVVMGFNCFSFNLDFVRPSVSLFTTQL